MFVVSQICRMVVAAANDGRPSAQVSIRDASIVSILALRASIVSILASRVDGTHPSPSLTDNEVRFIPIQPHTATEASSMHIELCCYLLYTIYTHISCERRSGSAPTPRLRGHRP